MFMRQNTRKKIPSAILAISSTWNILLSITEYSFCCFPFATLTCTESSLDPDFVPESESESCSVVSDSFRPHELYSPWNSPGQDTGMGSLSLLQGIFPTQGLNPGLPLCRQILYQLSHKGSPRILEWVACPFSRESSRPRHPTRGLLRCRRILDQVSHKGHTVPVWEAPPVLLLSGPVFLVAFDTLASWPEVFRSGGRGSSWPGKGVFGNCAVCLGNRPTCLFAGLVYFPEQDVITPAQVRKELSSGPGIILTFKGQGTHFGCQSSKFTYWVFCWLSVTLDD